MGENCAKNEQNTFFILPYFFHPHSFKVSTLEVDTISKITFIHTHKKKILYILQTIREQFYTQRRIFFLVF